MAQRHSLDISYFLEHNRPASHEETTFAFRKTLGPSDDECHRNTDLLQRLVVDSQERLG